jgi:hypothetical protein
MTYPNYVLGPCIGELTSSYENVKNKRTLRNWHFIHSWKYCKKLLGICYTRKLSKLQFNIFVELINLILTLMLTSCIHTHTHSLSLSLTHTHTHTHRLSLSPSHTHTHSWRCYAVLSTRHFIYPCHNLNRGKNAKLELEG